MKRLLAVSVFVFITVFGMTALAGDYFPKKFYFIGLWQGIDLTDGSEVQRSITYNRDGTFTILGYETFYTGCEGDRGIVEATAVLEDGALISKDFTLTCFKENGLEVIGPNVIKFFPDILNRTLEENYGGLGDFDPTVLHKISR